MYQLRGYFGRLINFDLQLFFPFESENIISGFKKVRGMPLVSASDFPHPCPHSGRLSAPSRLPPPRRASPRNPPHSRSPLHQLPALSASVQPGSHPPRYRPNHPHRPAAPLACAPVSSRRADSPGSGTSFPSRPAPPRHSAPRPLAPPPTPEFPGARTSLPELFAASHPAKSVPVLSRALGARSHLDSGFFAPPLLQAPPPSSP